MIDLAVQNRTASKYKVSFGFEKKIQRLVKGARECGAIKSGQVDAILDRSGGRAILLPDAQAALLERKAQFRSLMDLSVDGYWEQDENYRFVSHDGIAIGGVDILGKTLWELEFKNSLDVDWRTYRTQLEWRAVFRGLELHCVDRAGTLRVLSVSGQPVVGAGNQFKGYRGIVQDITAQRRVNNMSPEPDHFARSILDALPLPTCVLDSTGTVISSNAAWRAFAATRIGFGVDISVGSNYLDVCGQTAGYERGVVLALHDGIRQVMAGERDALRLECFDDGSFEQRWFVVSITRVHTDNGGRAIVAYEDITAIKSAEQLLKLEYTVARHLAETDNVGVALQSVIRAVCEAQRWDRGRYFHVDLAADAISLQECWSVGGAALDKILEKSLNIEDHTSADFADRAYKTAQPLWRSPGSEEAGRYGVFAVPVTLDHCVFGVLVFTGTSVRKPDERQLQAMRGIGYQLGRFLSRTRSEEGLRRREASLRRLVELSSDWVWEQNCDFRFTRIDGGGKAGTGHVVGRSLWDPAANVVLGELSWMQHKSVLAARWSFCDFEYAVKRDDGELSYFSISGEPVYDDAGTFTGYRGTGVDITIRKRAEIASRNAAQ